MLITRPPAAFHTNDDFGKVFKCSLHVQCIAVASAGYYGMKHLEGLFYPGGILVGAHLKMEEVLCAAEFTWVSRVNTGSSTISELQACIFTGCNQCHFHVL